MEVRELLTKYEFPGDDIPIIKGSALNALICESTDRERSRVCLHQGADGRR